MRTITVELDECTARAVAHAIDEAYKLDNKRLYKAYCDGCDVSIDYIEKRMEWYKRGAVAINDALYR